MFNRQHRADLPPLSVAEAINRLALGQITIIDVRDVAEAVRTSLSAPLVGAYAFPLTADDTIMDRPTRVLVEAAFPGVRVSGDLPEHGATVDTHSTRAVLGFTPHWSWRQILQEPGA